jgi:predicted ATPase with chaperone activity
MSLCLVRSRALLGLSAEPVTVEVHLANGLPSFTLVGLADTEVKEARERVRSALQTCGLEFPHNKRITVNLAPADLPKDSGRFDLPIAVGILAAGEISLAHHGVLFLDELAEFPRAALEALREPLETGHIRISRAARRTTFPAQFQLIAAMNPCPCGWLGATHKACRCTPDQISRYQGKLSGPLLDRIDLQVEVPALGARELLEASAGEASQSVRARCIDARARAMTRQGKANQALAGREIDHHAHLPPAASAFVLTAATRLAWSARATHRALKVARTIADLDASEAIEVRHVAEAVQYRRALLGPT